MARIDDRYLRFSDFYSELDSSFSVTRDVCDVILAIAIQWKKKYSNSELESECVV